MSHILASDRYVSGFNHEKYGVKMNDRVMIDGKRIGTILALCCPTEKKFVLLPRFLIRLDPVTEKEKSAPESLFKEVYLSQIRITGIT